MPKDLNKNSEETSSEKLSNKVHQHDSECPVTCALGLIGAKWKILIVYHLMQGTKRFNELQKLLPGITQKMLAMRLRELEKDQLIERKVYAVIPPKVEYTLTLLGQSLEKMIEHVKSWGNDLSDLAAASKIKRRKKKEEK